MPCADYIILKLKMKYSDKASARLFVVLVIAVRHLTIKGKYEYKDKVSFLPYDAAIVT